MDVVRQPESEASAGIHDAALRMARHLEDVVAATKGVVDALAQIRRALMPPVRNEGHEWSPVSWYASHSRGAG